MINYILNYHRESRRTGILGNFLFHMCIKSFCINTLEAFFKMTLSSGKLFMG